jgi:capsular polysaccharide export protein
MRAGDAPAMRLLGAAENSFLPSAIAAAAGAPRLSLPRSPASAAALAGLFPEFVVELGRPRPDASLIGAWAGTPELAHRRATAAARDAPFVVLGEGLLRAAPRAAADRPCLSTLALNILGPHSSVDALSPARVLAQRGWEIPALLQRAAAAREALVSGRVGGTWWQTGGEGALPHGDGYALVVLDDPVVADGEPAAEAVLAGMLDTALAEHPPDRVIVLPPGVGAHHRLGAMLSAAAARGAIVVAPPVDPWTAIDHAERVYTAGGEIGFLALLAGRAVRCFGPAFYTGWGITEDDAAVPRRPFRRTLDEIFSGGCLVAARYLDPFRNTPASFEDTLALLRDWRRLDEANRHIGVCVGMSFWKRRRVADFVASSAGSPVFRRTAQSAVTAALGASDAPPGAIAAWASRIPEGLAEAAARHGIPLIRVEDGFVRSVGLGADFLPPASLVFDAGGMYYDPRTRSDLETLLRETEFTPALVERAARLIAQLVARGVTKYNLAGSAPQIDMPAGQRTILVPGQVEDDLSVLYGGGEIRGNLDLLKAVRQANPDGFVLYKPHPDVLAGHRKGAVPDAEARRFADTIVQGVSTASLLDRIDELHTMTSLVGFEALLRRRRVVVYGRPFYAGWGLTEDQLTLDRGRWLTLDELVAGVLILYPRYLDPLTRLPCGPEVIIERLDQPELWRPGALVLARRLQGALARRFGEIRAGLRNQAE